MSDGDNISPDRTDAGFSVGVLIDSVDSFLNRRVLGELIDAADEYGLRLVFFFGGSIERNRSSGPYSFAYTLPSRKSVQAIIVFPHSIAPYSPYGQTRLILQQFPDIPAYSLFARIPGVFSVSTAEREVIGDLVRHLANEHGYRRMAVLRGPDGDDTLSSSRLDAIRDALTGTELELPDNLVFPGDFSEDAGREAARKILSLPDTAPDVLVCLNDQMAIGAALEFQNNGISVPEDIAVTGVDDVWENETVRAPLTTVNIPVYETVGTLVERLHSDLTGKTAYEALHLEIPAQLAHRESCGCTSYFEKILIPEKGFTPPDQKRTPKGTLKRAAQLRRSLKKVLEECLSTRDTRAFNVFMEDTIKKLSRTGDFINTFIDSFSTQWTITLLKYPDFDSQSLVNSLFVDAFRLLLQSKTQTLTRMHTSDLGSLSFYRNCTDLLAGNISVADAMEGIGANVAKLGIADCLLVSICGKDPDRGEVRLQYRQNGRLTIPHDPFPSFPLQDLAPKGLGSGPHIAILPIAHNNTVYGYLILSVEEKHFEQFPIIQETVSHLVDAAMANDRLSTHIETLTKNNDVLSRLSVIDELTGLYNRRALYVTGYNLYREATENHQSSCVIFLDMDGLKQINDTFGHQDGDKAILSLAGILGKSFRDDDLVVRYGGDEFVILMVDISEDTLFRALDRISGELAAFNSRNENPWVLSASWGYVFNEAGCRQRPFEEIIAESDEKLYEKKRKRKAARNDAANEGKPE